MRIDDIDIKKGGALSFDSIFEFESSLDVTALISKCRTSECAIRFEAEDLTIDSNYGDNPTLRAIVTLYSLLIDYPKAAQDYYNYLFKKANEKNAPGT